VQAIESSQDTTAPAWQVPPEQVSVPLQNSPSSQSLSTLQGAAMQPWTGSQISAARQAPLSGTYPQASASSSQESVVQATESSQLTAVPDAQTSFWQVSAPLHQCPSSQS
jgi:hypothetical protein